MFVYPFFSAFLLLLGFYLGVETTTHQHKKAIVTYVKSQHAYKSLNAEYACGDG